MPVGADGGVMKTVVLAVVSGGVLTDIVVGVDEYYLVDLDNIEESGECLHCEEELDGLYCPNCGMDFGGEAIDIFYQFLERDGLCPKCFEKIRTVEHNGKFYTYCEECGPISDIGRIMETDDNHIIGYPPIKV